VSPHMRELVMTAVDDLGYRPDLLARGMRSRNTMAIGYVVANISNPIVADIVTGAEARLRSAGYSILLTNSEGYSSLDAANIGVLAQRRVDGLLLSLAREDDPEITSALADLDIPIVLVDRYPPPNFSAWSVGFDHRAGMAAATRHLIDLGHRRIAVIVGGPRRPAQERSQGVRDALDLVRETHCHVYDGEFSVEHGIAATLRILRDEPKATAIVAGGNLLMQGSLQALHANGVRVGEEMSFVGCDDNPLAGLHDPPISVVRRDCRALGVEAAELLLLALEGAAPLEVKLLPTEFVARASCTVPHA